MKIRSVDAAWLHCPLPASTQHVSDFGRIAAFDAVLEPKLRGAQALAELQDSDKAVFYVEVIGDGHVVE